MDSRPTAGRAVFHAVLTSLLVPALLAAGCVPPKKKIPKGEDVTSAPSAPAAAVQAVNPLSRTWQRLAALEGKTAGIGAIAVGNAVAQKSGAASPAKSSRIIAVSMDVTGQLRKPFVEAVLTLDASPARITGAEVSEENPSTAFYAAKGRAGWRMQYADGQPQVSQKLRLQIEAPAGAEPIEIRIQRSFKKANGDMFNSTQPTPENLEAQRLLDLIRKELARRAKGNASDVSWLGVGDCASVKGEEINGQCRPSDDSWRLAEQRAAVLCSAPWQEKLTLQISGAAVTQKKQEAVTKPAESAQPVEVPKPVEAAQPVEAPKPAESAQPAESPKPAESVQPVEVPKPVEEAQPAEAPKPAESVQPVESPKPAQAAKPAEAPKPATAVKPAPEKPKSVAAPKTHQDQAKKPAKPAPKPEKGDGGGKPIYDLSDVLNKHQ